MQRYMLLAAASLMFCLIASSAVRFPASEYPAVASGSTARQHDAARHLSFPSAAELKLVQVVHRHGARTPLNTIYAYAFPGLSWPNCEERYPGVDAALFDEHGSGEPPPILDPATPLLPGGCREGQLTRNGYDMALDLGTWLRSRYVDSLGFLPPAWQPGLAALRTTPIRRTIATLRGVMTGLWPDTKEALQVGASYPDAEIMYGSSTQCPALKGLYDALNASLQQQDAKQPDMLRLATLVAASLNLEPPGPPGSETGLQWTKLYDTVAAIRADNSSLLPSTFTGDATQVLYHQAERHEAGYLGPGDDLCPPGGQWPSRCRDVLRFSIGQLVARLMANVDRAVVAAGGGAGAEATDYTAAALLRGRRLRAAAAKQAASTKDAAGAADVQPSEPGPQLYVYSGHDSSITPLLAVLGQAARAWPPFAANVVLELWRGRPDDFDDYSSSSESSSSSRSAKAQHGAATAADAGSQQQQQQASAHHRAVLAAAASTASAKHGGGSSSSSKDSESAFWVRILYNTKPLIIPHLSSRGGLLPLEALRSHLAPYELSLQQLKQLCGANATASTAVTASAAAAKGQ